jgi:RimJ/RimL family protein N-acetyltransferase
VSYPPRATDDLDERVTLANHSHVRIRPLRCGEQHGVRDLYARLSPQSRYFRFFSYASVLSDDTMQRLTCVEDRRRFVLVAECGWSGSGELIALANLGGIGEHDAEVALLVRDDWQRQRLGTALAIRLMATAERHGFERFVAYTLWNNLAVRRLLARVGRVLSAHVSGGVSELTFVSHHREATRSAGDITPAQSLGVCR